MKKLLLLFLLVNSFCSAQKYLGKTYTFIKQSFHQSGIRAKDSIDYRGRLIISQSINDDKYNVVYIFGMDKNGKVNNYSKFMPNDLLWQTDVIKWVKESGAAPVGEWGTMGDEQTPISNQYTLGDNIIDIHINPPVVANGIQLIPERIRMTFYKNSETTLGE